MRKVDDMNPEEEKLIINMIENEYENDRLDFKLQLYDLSLLGKKIIQLGL